MEIAVTIALGVAGALGFLAYTDIKAFRDLYQKADTPLLCVAVLGIGVMGGSIMGTYGYGWRAILNTGAAISACAVGAVLFAGLLAWLRRDA